MESKIKLHGHTHRLPHQREGWLDGGHFRICRNRLLSDTPKTISDKMAAILGHEKDYQRFHALSRKLKEVYKRHFLKKGCVVSKRQCKYVRPFPGGSLTFAWAEYESCKGTIVSEWKRNGDIFMLRAEIPDGVHARIELPDKTNAELSGGKGEWSVPFRSSAIP